MSTGGINDQGGQAIRFENGVYSFTPSSVPSNKETTILGDTLGPGEAPPSWFQQPVPQPPPGGTSNEVSLENWKGNLFMKPSPIGILSSVMLQIVGENKMAAFLDKLRGVELNILSIQQAVQEGKKTMEMAKQEARKEMLQATTAIVSLVGTIVAYGVSMRMAGGQRDIARGLASGQAIKANMTFEMITKTFESSAQIYEKIESSKATLARGEAEAARALIDALKSQTQQAAQQAFEAAGQKEDQLDKAVQKFFDMIHAIFQSYNWRQ